MRDFASWLYHIDCYLYVSNFCCSIHEIPLYYFISTLLKAGNLIWSIAMYMWHHVVFCLIPRWGISEIDFDVVHSRAWLFTGTIGYRHSYYFEEFLHLTVNQRNRFKLLTCLLLLLSKFFFLTLLFFKIHMSMYIKLLFHKIKCNYSVYAGTKVTLLDFSGERF